MRELTILFIHLIVTAAKLMRPGGGRGVVAESLLLKQQLLFLIRGRERASNLRPIDRVIAGLCTLVIRPGRTRWTATHPVRAPGRSEGMMQVWILTRGRVTAEA
jgi:hypothetical protein